MSLDRTCRHIHLSVLSQVNLIGVDLRFRFKKGNGRD